MPRSQPGIEIAARNQSANRGHQGDSSEVMAEDCEYDEIGRSCES